MEFFTWEMLGTAAGSALAVGVLTQITKDVPFIKTIPTQVWSYILSLVVLLLAQVFGPGLTAESGVLAVFNAAIVSLASNGGFDAIKRITEKDE